jgi:hypothetical protein
MKTSQRDPMAEQADAQSRDELWDLLRQSPPVRASADFADRVIFASRESELQANVLWTRARLAIASVAAIAAALALVASIMMTPDTAPTVTQQAPIAEDGFASLDEVAQQEMLLAATDHLGEFSNTELVTLIGF